MKERRKGMLLVVSGPSGTGKGTLCERLLRSDPTIMFGVSATTRKPREGEIDGVHYHFIDEERFDKMLAEKAFLEHATVHGHRYGTPKDQVERAIEEGRNILLDIDPQGALSVMSAMPETVSIFILPPSYSALRERLHTRNTDDPDEILKRLSNAYGEVRLLKHYTYALVNDRLDQAFGMLSAIIMAEKHRTTRYFPEIYEE
ncbi:MAG: guanylate kinase [Clostridiales bacterium]|jgi:guanylate kinase|nr:guanylate kinase [Clostridia bacterium]NLD01909.1 guanylate kinase [Clostridiales bacterium]